MSTLDDLIAQVQLLDPMLELQPPLIDDLGNALLAADDTTQEAALRAILPPSFSRTGISRSLAYWNSPGNDQPGPLGAAVIIIRREQRTKE